MMMMMKIVMMVGKMMMGMPNKFSAQKLNCRNEEHLPTECTQGERTHWPRGLGRRPRLPVS